WVRPTMVIEANLRGWTADGLVRQAAFKGVREDKPPREVVREYPAATEAKGAGSRRKARSKIAAEASKTVAKKTKRIAKAASRSATKRASKPTTSKSPASKSSPSKSSANKSSATRPWKEGDVRFTHPDRVYWVDVGITKQDLADYYTAVWD